MSQPDMIAVKHNKLLESLYIRCSLDLASLGKMNNSEYGWGPWWCCLNVCEQKWIIIQCWALLSPWLNPLSVCSVRLWYSVARQIKWVAHSNSTSIKMAVYKLQINGQLVVVGLARAALIINPITFHSAPVMKVKAIRGWFGCLGNRSKCSIPPRELGLPSDSATQVLRLAQFPPVWSTLVLSPALYLIISLNTTDERCAFREPRSRGFLGKNTELFCPFYVLSFYLSPGNFLLLFPYWCFVDT